MTRCYIQICVIMGCVITELHWLKKNEPDLIPIYTIFFLFFEVSSLRYQSLSY